MMKHIGGFLLALLLISGCSSYSDLNEFSWMLGSWTSTDEKNGVDFYENWNKSGSTSFNGAGIAVDLNGDTLFKETLKLELIDGVPYYVATVPKNPGPVLFRMAETTKQSVVFENKEHDFPQRIRYELVGEQLSIRLEGVEKGSPKIQKILLQRIKESIPNLK